MKGQEVYRLLGISIAVAFCLFSVNSVLAIDVYEGVLFETKGTNTTFIMGKNLTFEKIEVRSTYLVLDNQTISVSPSEGSANVTIENFTITIIELNVTTDTSSNLTFEIGNLSINKNYTIYNNSQLYIENQTNGSGYLNFVFYNTDGQFFEINTTKRADGEPCLYDSECEGGYCVHGYCRSSSTYCGDGYCDSGETCSSCSADCGACDGGDGGNGGGIVLPPTTNVSEEVTEGICEPDVKRCFENNLQKCDINGTGWVVIETCEYGCDPESLSCKTEMEIIVPICEPGTTRCSDNILQRCSSDGYAWETIETCEYQCVDNKCVEEVPWFYNKRVQALGVLILLLIILLIIVAKLKPSVVPPKLPKREIKKEMVELPKKIIPEKPRVVSEEIPPSREDAEKFKRMKRRLSELKTRLEKLKRRK